MEDKDLQTVTPVPENPLSDPQAPAESGFNGQATKNRAAQSSARERLRDSVLEEEKTVKASNYMRPGGLFEGYEITNAKEMPLFMRVFAASALVHLVIFAAALQLPAVVETTCESTEFTQQVCNTIYVASLLNTDRNTVDQPYSLPEIPTLTGDEEITMLDTSDFEYPEGYWTLRDEIEGRTPEDVTMLDPTSGVNLAGISPSPLTPTPSNGFDLTKRQRLPKNNPNAIKGSVDDLDGPFNIGGGESAGTPRTSTGGPLSNGGGKRGISNSGKNTTNGNNSVPGIPGTTQAAATPKPNPTKTPNNPTVASSNPDIETNADGIEINKRPLKDFAGDLKKQVDGNQVNMSAPFSLTASGVLGNDGKFDIDKTAFTNFTGDKKMIDVAMIAIRSLNASGYLGYLKALGNKNLVLQLTQDQDNITVAIQSEVENDINAQRIASGLNVLIMAGKLRNQGTDEGVLLQNANVTNQGNVFKLNFSLPQNVAQPLIKKKLAEVDNSGKVNSFPAEGNKNDTASK